MGLLQLSPNGKAHLIPITILYDGEFYDASAYKASPVPMALESGTVYEAVHTGVSQGLFTVSSALQGNNTWIGEGTWQSAADLAAAAALAAKKKEARSKPAPEPVEGPPVLRRASAAKAPEPAPSSPPADSKPAPTASAPVSAAPAPAAAPPAPTPAPPVAEEDPNRPVLKRGAPSPAELKKRNAAASTPTSTPAKGTAHAPANSPGRSGQHFQKHTGDIGRRRARPTPICVQPEAGRGRQAAQEGSGAGSRRSAGACGSTSGCFSGIAHGTQSFQGGSARQVAPAQL